MDTTRPPSRAWRATATALLGLLLALPALAQWQWVDATGRKVFSDTAPPPSVPDRNILKRPGNLPVAAAPASVPATATPATPAAPQLVSRDAELEARKKAAEEAELEKKKAEQARLAQVRADNCERARKARATFDSGVRVATINAKGEREIMDDTMRATETRRLDQVIQTDCAPLPQ